jgi:hypothetical protein
LSAVVQIERLGSGERRQSGKNEVFERHGCVKFQMSTDEIGGCLVC